MSYETVLAPDGVRLGYERFGAGAPSICVVPGHPLSARALQAAEGSLAAIRQFAELGLIALSELRGCGRSDKHGPYDYRSLAEDVAAICADLNAPPTVVWGNRSGSLIALQVAFEHPETVDGVVLDTLSITDAVSDLVAGDSPKINDLSDRELDDVVFHTVAATVQEATQGATNEERERIVQELHRAAPLEVWRESIAVAWEDQVDYAGRLTSGDAVPQQPIIALVPGPTLSGPAEQLISLLRNHGANLTIAELPNWCRRLHDPASAAELIATLRPWLDQLPRPDPARQSA